MTRFYAALKARYDATAGDSLRAVMTGGYYLGVAPIGTPMPHLTVAPGGEQTDGTMGISYREGIIVTMTLWATRFDLTNLYGWLELLTALYDNYLPTFAAGGRVILCVRQNSGTLIELPNPEAGYGLQVDYRYKWTTA
jgi:hypothetical protein